MTTQELKEYINKTLGISIRCLLPSYWWKRLFGLVIDKIGDVDNKIDETSNKIVKLPTKIYVDKSIREAIDDIDIDIELSDTSTNAVENRAVKKYIDGPVFIIGFNEDTGEVTLTNDERANNIQSFQEAYNKILSPRATLSMYLTNSDRSGVKWFHSVNWPITISRYGGMAFVDIKVSNIYGQILFEGQTIDVIPTADGNIEIVPHTGYLEFTKIFAHPEMTIIAKKHNAQVWQYLSTKRGYAAIMFIENGIQQVGVFPATLTKEQDPNSGSYSVYITIVRYAEKITMELNSDGTLTEISNTSILNQE